MTVNPFPKAIKTLARIMSDLEQVTRPSDRPNPFVDADEPVVDPAWEGWAVPAICDVLAGHIPFDVDDGPRVSCYHPKTGNAESFNEWFDWREHVAPIIAARIGCDPARAIAALQRYDPR